MLLILSIVSWKDFSGTYDVRLFDTCSPEVKKVYRFLIEQYEDQKLQVPVEIAKIESLPKKAKEILDNKFRLASLQRKLVLEFDSLDSEFIYSLSKIGSPYTKRYVDCWKKDPDVFFSQPTEIF